MADSTASPEDTEPNSQPPGPVNPISQSNHPDPSLPQSSSSSTPPTTAVAADPNPNPNPNPNPHPNPNANATTPPPPFVSLPQPPSIQPYAPVQVSSVPPSAPSFRPAAPPVPFHTAPQFSPLPNSNFQAQSFQNPGVQPPGVGPVPVMMPSAASGVGLGSVAISSAPPIMSPYAPPGQPPNPAMRSYAPMPNGYPTMPAPPPGILRYPSPYSSMVRPAFPPRPLGPVGFIPALSRPPVPGIRGPIILPVMRPAIIPSVTPTEKPQTTVYIGKIASTVENDFMLSLLQLCGPVKSWKRVQDPTSGALKGFGFCEFDSAEGVLRALRLLSKLNIDGQELMLNVNQATREYLERYVEKKKENSRNLKATETDGAEKEEGSASGAEKDEPPQPSVEDSKEDNKDIANKESHDLVNFGLVTDEDKEADREGLEKLTGMIEERLKAKPLPPPPPPPTADGPGNSNLEVPARSRDGDSDVDIMRQDAAEDKNDDEMTSESKPLSEQDKPETSSPDRSRRNDRRSRDRERDMKREKERELERYEREREQERAKREREREYKIREDERRYRARVKEWESREREREHSRKLEKEREKEREQERKWEIIDQERDSDDGYTKKRKYKSSGEDRKRRFREKEEDLADRLKEEEEIAEAKKRAEEELLQQKEQEKDTVKILSGHATNESDKALFTDETNVEIHDKDDDQTSDGDSGRGNHTGDGILQNGISDESVVESATSDTRQSSNAPTRKLGFGLVGSGKRTTVPSVFHEEEDEDAQKDKKMRPLVPIDYSTEELQAVRDTISGAPSPNLVAAAEFAKRIANVNPREDRPEAERERSRRPHERYSHRDRDHHRNDEATYRTKDESRTETVDRDKDRERGLDKVKTQDNRKLLDAKQLIDTIPKTKDELFSYEINWAIYDKNELHEKMRPWISKKITEFLGEEETTLVNYIVSSTQEHVKAPEMLERLQAILDDEAEMFVLKMWRMLIFEIKRVETGLSSRSKT